MLDGKKTGMGHQSVLFSWSISIQLFASFGGILKEMGKQQQRLCEGGDGGGGRENQGAVRGQRIRCLVQLTFFNL